MIGALLCLATVVRAEEIVVSAAASLKDAFQDIGRTFEADSGVKVQFNFGASGVLQKQIEGGAPVDVFASAGQGQMDALEARDLIAKDTRHNLAGNALVLVTSPDNPLGLKSFDGLDNPNLQRLAIGNPKTVPAGQYTRQLLQNLKVWENLQSRLVFAEDVRQVLEYVARGEVDAGIVYASDVSVAHGKVAVVARAPAKFHDPILYPIAVVKDSRHAAAAKRFLERALGADGQAVFEKYGFLGTR